MNECLPHSRALLWENARKDDILKSHLIATHDMKAARAPSYDKSIYPS